MNRRWYTPITLGLLLSLCIGLLTAGAEERAGSWQSDALGYWYQYEDGSSPKSAWIKVENHWYYMDKGGYILTGWRKIDGYLYHFNPTGDLALGWQFYPTDGNWYYFTKEGKKQTGWFFDQEAWYWFNDQGVMECSGYKTIEATRYYFFDNGQMAQYQYVGTFYMNGDGQRDKTYDIVVEGDQTDLTSEERDGITEALKCIPRGWIRHFNERNWKMMYYRNKTYFSAPEVDGKPYYIYHKLDINYRKLKFAEPDSLTQAFGEYIGYGAGCYEENSSYAQELTIDQRAVEDIIELPGYFSEDKKFYFGSLCAAYLDDFIRWELEAEAPNSYRMMELILQSRKIK